MSYCFGKRIIALCFALFIASALLWGPRAADAGSEALDQTLPAIRAEAIRAHMNFLADDLLEGRATGTRGHEIAARYMASEFEAIGLEPAGENGTYFQSVPLRSIRPDEQRTALAFVLGGKEKALVFRRDFVSYGDPGRISTSVEAPVVYVGFGVTASDQRYDDYAGVEAKGKIIAYLSGAPASFPSTIRAHYSSAKAKAANAVAHGAVGTILLDSPELEQRYPFEERVRDLSMPELRWLDSNGQPNDYFPQLRGTAILSMNATAELLEGSGREPKDVYEAASQGKPSSFAVPITVKIRVLSMHQGIRSPNVIARLRGNDSQLQSQYVVYTAHLDHLGIGEAVKGDRIYNGALDNAAGSACLLEIARAFTELKLSPRRSVLFVSVTGEEEGLLGSDYFAQHPTVPKDALVANINMDGAALLWPIQDVIAYGAEHSSLGTTVNQAASLLGLEVSPDPRPEQVFFIRSDQYSFVKQGIPSVFVMSGLKSNAPAIKPPEIIANWRKSVYHKPQDDMTQPFDFRSGARFAQFNFLVGYLIAQRTEKPAWNPGDFFGEQYGPSK